MSGRSGSKERLSANSGHEIDRLRPSSLGSPSTGREPTDGSTSWTGSRLVSIRHHPSLWIGPALLLVAALFPWPYGYYVLLRIVVFVVAAWIAYEQWRLDDAISGRVVMFGAIALLYNPFLPIHLTKELWSVLNLTAAALFLWHLRDLRRLTENLSRMDTQFSARSLGERISSPSCAPGEKLPRK